MEETNLISADLLFKILSFLVPIGAIFVGIALERFKGRTFVLDKTVTIDRFASSIADNNFGKIEVLHDGRNVNHIFFIKVELENKSWRVIEDFGINISLNIGPTIINFNALLIDDLNNTSNVIFYTQDFKNFVNEAIKNNKLDPEDRPADQDGIVDLILRERRFYIPYVNKRQKLYFDFMLSSDNENIEVYIVPTKGNIKIQTVLSHEDFKAKRNKIISITNIFLFFVFVYPIIKYSPTIQSSVLLMILNVFGSYLISYVIYYSINFMKSFFYK